MTNRICLLWHLCARNPTVCSTYSFALKNVLFSWSLMCYFPFLYPIGWKKFLGHFIDSPLRKVNQEHREGAWWRKLINFFRARWPLWSFFHLHIIWNWVIQFRLSSMHTQAGHWVGHLYEQRRELHWTLVSSLAWVPKAMFAGCSLEHTCTTVGTQRCLLEMLGCSS